MKHFSGSNRTIEQENRSNYWFSITMQRLRLSRKLSEVDSVNLGRRHFAICLHLREQTPWASQQKAAIDSKNLTGLKRCWRTFLSGRHVSLSKILRSVERILLHPEFLRDRRSVKYCVKFSVR